MDYTPLHVACSEGNVATMQVCVGMCCVKDCWYGCSLCQAGGERGGSTTAFKQAGLHTQQGRCPVLMTQALIAAGADVDAIATATFGRPPMFMVRLLGSVGGKASGLVQQLCIPCIAPPRRRPLQYPLHYPMSSTLARPPPHLPTAVGGRQRRPGGHRGAAGGGGGREPALLRRQDRSAHCLRDRENGRGQGAAVRGRPRVCGASWNSLCPCLSVLSLLSHQHCSIGRNKHSLELEGCVMYV